MIHLLTACTDDYKKAASNLCLSAMKQGINDYLIEPIESISPVAKRLFAGNINERNRIWFYIWKPYLIWETIISLPKNDILIYADAGQIFTDSIFPLFDDMDQDIMLFHNPWKHVEWCKGDVYYAINGMVNNERKQVQASLIIFKVTPSVIDLVKEWMLWCMMPGFCDNSPSKMPNFPTFQEHRYDQAVLTCLQIKYGYRLHEIPRIDNGNAKYKCINHHRNKW